MYRPTQLHAKDADRRNRMCGESNKRRLTDTQCGSCEREIPQNAEFCVDCWQFIRLNNNPMAILVAINKRHRYHSHQPLAIIQSQLDGYHG